MNENGRNMAEKLARKEYSPIEYRNKLVRMKNMDCLCHCSAEIDMGTLLYFSVNDLYLAQGNYVILLFSEISDPTPEQEDGRDVFSRVYTYSIIEDVATEVFTGHYSIYSSELDGRLVMFLNFPFGLLPDRSIVDYLDDNCLDVCERCRSRYDMNVISYISDPIDNIRHISSVYTKLLETATLHRYTNRTFQTPVYHVAMPAPEKWGTRHASTDDCAKELVSAIVKGEDFHALNDEILRQMATNEFSGIDNLKRMCGDYFELICVYAARMGIKLKTDDLREEEFHVLFDSVRWEEPVQWMHSFLDRLHTRYAETAQKESRRVYEQAIEYIDASFSDAGLTIEKCAAVVGCGVSTLTKAFRRYNKTSVAKYIQELRLDRAEALLREGASVGDTCARCGFGSTETFHRAFKAKYNITPGQYRSAVKSEN